MRGRSQRQQGACEIVAFLTRFLGRSNGSRNYRCDFMTRNKSGPSMDTFDEFLAEQGMLADCEERALKEIIADQIREETKAQAIAKTTRAARLRKIRSLPPSRNWAPRRRPRCSPCRSKTARRLRPAMLPARPRPPTARRIFLNIRKPVLTGIITTAGWKTRNPPGIPIQVQAAAPPQAIL